MSKKREQVIDTARELFSNKGYKQVSMDEIAKVSGVTKRTIYSYFKDKNDLIKYFLYEELNKMRDMLVKIDESDKQFGARIHDLLMMLIEYRTNSKLLNAFYKESEKSRLKIADECTYIMEKAFREEIKIRLEKAIEDGYVKTCDPDMTAFIIYKVYIALIFDWNKPLNKEEVADNIMAVLENGLFS